MANIQNNREEKVQRISKLWLENKTIEEIKSIEKLKSAYSLICYERNKGRWDLFPARQRGRRGKFSRDKILNISKLWIEEKTLEEICAQENISKESLTSLTYYERRTGDPSLFPKRTKEPTERILSEKNKSIIEMYLTGDYTQENIALKNKCSKQNISLVLKRFLTEEQLEEAKKNKSKKSRNKKDSAFLEVWNDRNLTEEEATEIIYSSPENFFNKSPKNIDSTNKIKNLRIRYLRLNNNISKEKIRCTKFQLERKLKSIEKQKRFSEMWNDNLTLSEIAEIEGSTQGAVQQYINGQRRKGNIDKFPLRRECFVEKTYKYPNYPADNNYK